MIFPASVLLIFAFLVSSPGMAVRHELPDGFVERGIAIVVRNDFARIEYRIGASDTTMRRQLAEWNRDAGEREGGELHRHFAESALACLPGELRMFADGRALEFVAVEGRVGGQHHVSAVITLDVPLADIQGLARIRIEDHAFGNLDGAIRLAIKSTDSVMTRSSKYAPALVRAERLILPPLAGSRRHLPAEIRAQMIFPGDRQPSPGPTGSVEAPGRDGVDGTRIRLDRAWLEKDGAPTGENGPNPLSSPGLLHSRSG